MTQFIVQAWRLSLEPPSSWNQEAGVTSNACDSNPKEHTPEDSQDCLRTEEHTPGDSLDCSLSSVEHRPKDS